VIKKSIKTAQIIGLFLFYLFMERAPINRLRNKSEEMERLENDAKVNAKFGEFEEVLTEQEYNSLSSRISGLQKLLGSAEKFYVEADQINEILSEKLGVVQDSFNLRVRRFNEEGRIADGKFRNINEFSDLRTINALSAEQRKELAMIKESKVNESRRIQELMETLQFTISSLHVNRQAW